MPRQIDIELFPTQVECFKYLEDKTTNQILFGGGAGGGKTIILVLWQIHRRLTYPGTRGVIGRSKLKTLKQTTLNTFFEVATDFLGLKPNEDFVYNAQESTIKFSNDSIIYLKDLFLYPSDPLFTSLGGLEITDCAIDEASEITMQAFQVLQSRIRYKLDENNLIPKILLTCNPSKGWLYSSFYKPDREDKLPNHKKFIKSLVTDNSKISSHYVKQLEQLDKVSRARLLLGDWEYNIDDANLFEFDALHDLFSNSVKEGQKYISCDVARFGDDKTIICLWNGLNLIKIVSLAQSSVKDTYEAVSKIAKDSGVRRSNIVIDSDGIGGGVADFLSGSKAFLNGSKAIKGENFQNLKTQCYFKLAELVNEGKIAIQDKAFQQEIIEELEIVRRDKIDKDSIKLSIEGKDKQKQRLGRSPDIGDALMMRMYYEVKTNHGVYVF